MENIIVGGILLIAIGAAVWHIVKSKKKGIKCIGCPAGGCCPHSKKTHTTCQCAGQMEKEHRS